MGNVNLILDQRMKKSSDTSKMSEMAKKSASGNLTSFSGMFNVTELNTQEKEVLAEILRNYSDESLDIHQDLNLLISITSEVKAINNQAALLHGERIKRVHQMLVKYRDGAFTAWLITAYGNRQTPYNLMQYYEFYESMPKALRPIIELMPRQAIYVLATRVGEIEKKQQVVENYQGQTKTQMLALIQELFPLNEQDKRQKKAGIGLIRELQKMCVHLEKKGVHLTSNEKQCILTLLQQLQSLVVKI